MEDSKIMNVNVMDVNNDLTCQTQVTSTQSEKMQQHGVVDIQATTPAFRIVPSSDADKNKIPTPKLFGHALYESVFQKAKDAYIKNCLDKKVTALSEATFLNGVYFTMDKFYREDRSYYDNYVAPIATQEPEVIQEPMQVQEPEVINVTDDVDPFAVTATPVVQNVSVVVEGKAPAFKSAFAKRPGFATVLEKARNYVLGYETRSGKKTTESIFNGAVEKLIREHYEEIDKEDVFVEEVTPIIKAVPVPAPAPAPAPAITATPKLEDAIPEVMYLNHCKDDLEKLDRHLLHGYDSDDIRYFMKHTIKGVFMKLMQTGYTTYDLVKINEDIIAQLNKYYHEESRKCNLPQRVPTKQFQKLVYTVPLPYEKLKAKVDKAMGFYIKEVKEEIKKEAVVVEKLQYEKVNMSKAKNEPAYVGTQISSIDALCKSSKTTHKLSTESLKATNLRAFYKNTFGWLTQPNTDPLKMYGDKPVPAAGKKPARRMTGVKKSMNTDGTLNFDDKYFTDECDIKKGENISCFTGRCSNVFVVDIDLPKNGEFNSLDYLVDLVREAGGNLFNYTLTTRSGSGGYHLLFKTTSRVHVVFPTSVSKSLKTETGVILDIDFKTDGGNITLPPSLNQSGNQYCFIANEIYEPQEMPDILFDILVKLKANASKKPDIGYNAKADPFSEMFDPTLEENKYTKSSKFGDGGEDRYTAPNDIAKVTKAVEALKKERFSSYDCWVKLLLALRWVGDKNNQSDEYLEFAKEFSKKCPGWDSTSESIIDATWKTARAEKPITIGTIYHWLKQDNPFDAYEKIIPSKEMMYEDRENHKICFTDSFDKFHEKCLDDPGVREAVYKFFRSCISYVATLDGEGFYMVLNYKVNIKTGISQRVYNMMSINAMAKKLGRVKLTYIDKNKKGSDDDGKIKYSETDLNRLLDRYFNRIKFNYAEFYPISKKSPIYDKCIKAQLDGGVLNLFSGFPCTYEEEYKVDEALIKPILDHVYFLAGGDAEANIKDCYEYFLNWMAHAVQKPDHKSGKCLVIMSSQGSGKSMFFTWYGKYILGKDYYYMTEDMSRVTGRFNNETSCKLLTVMEEAVDVRENANVNSILKSLITREEGMFEEKYKNALTLRDFCNFVILTNKFTTVKIEETDRRYVCFNASDENLGKTEYFNNLSSLMERQDVAEHFYNYLMQRDISKFVLGNIPETAFKAAMRGASAEAEVVALQVILENDTANKKGRHVIEYKKGRYNEAKVVDLYATSDTEHPISDYRYIGTPDDLYNDYLNIIRDVLVKTTPVSKTVYINTLTKSIGFKAMAHCSTSMVKALEHKTRKSVLVIDRSVLIEKLNRMCNCNFVHEELPTHGGGNKREMAKDVEARERERAAMENDYEEDSANGADPFA